MGDNGRGRFRVGLDIGGTFTDLAVFDGEDQKLFQVKTLSSEDPVECVTAGLTKAAGYFDLDLRGFLGLVDRVFCFGSTHGLNTLLTGQGSAVGILTTKGHRDSYAIAQMDRQGIEDVRLAAEGTFKGLVPRSRVREVSERVDYSGKTIIELDEAGVETAVRELVEQEGIEALAIAFLWSHKKPAHEARAAEIARELYPDLYVTASADLSGTLGEFTRLSTAVINAYIGKRVQAQASQLREFLEVEGLEVPILVMQMLGGVAPIEEIAKRPVALLKSGPVGGTVAGVAVLRDHEDVANAVCIDMGGTSLDVSRITHGEMQQGRGFKILKHPIMIPGVQIESVGAGGGSIAVFEEAGGLGRLRVGPESAGSRPGPACYGRGGIAPTVTDANLVLRILNPEVPLGGEIKLDPELASESIRRVISERVGGQDVVESAWGIYQVITAQMADAIEHFMVTNGVDVRQHALMAFGAATPQHALALAARLGTPKVIIPAASPVFSAYGLMMTDIRHAYEITDDSVKFAIHGPDVQVEDDQAGQVRAHLERAAARPLELLRREEVDLAERELSLSIDMRYTGQELELAIEIPASFTAEGTADHLEQMVRAWQEKYAQVYGEGAVWSDGSIEVIHYRAIAVGRLDAVAVKNASNGAVVSVKPRGTREIFLGEPLNADVYSYESMVPGTEIAGPAVVEGELTTVVLGPGDRLFTDRSGNFVATPGESWQS